EQTVSFLQDLVLEEFAEDRRRGRDGAIRLRGDPGGYGSVRSVLQQPLGAVLRLADDSAFFTRAFLSRAIALGLSRERPGRRVMELLNLNGVVVLEKFRQIL